MAAAQAAKARPRATEMTTLPDLASRLRALVGRPALAVPAALAAALGALSTGLPLFGVPGYELSSEMALAVGLLGLASGALSGRLERARLIAQAPPERPSPTRAVLLAYTAACLVPLAALLPPLAASVARALAGARCSPWTGMGFYLLLPVPSALVASALGLACGLSTSRARAAAALCAAAALLSLATSLWPLFAGPQVFALSHLFGYFPGPLYDEALAVDGRLWLYRGLTLAWAALLVAFACASLDPASGKLRRPRPGPLGTAGLLALAAAVGAGGLFDSALGLRTTEADLDRALGGRRETAHFVLHFPRAKPRLDQERLERDLELRYRQVTGFLGAAPAGKVDAFFYRSPEEKRRLVGASDTNFAKPWRRQLHVLDAPFPHPVIRHELAHVVAGAFGSPVLRISARAGVVMNAGIVEGLAVAADDRADELTLHEWAAAMRRLKLAPDIRDIVGPAGFYRQPAARSYTLAGSFLRFLAAERGAAALRALYPSGDFQRAFGAPLSALAGEWEAFLDALPLGPQGLSAAQVHFERGSLFERPCAREVAQLRADAEELKRSDPDRALDLFRRCAAIDPHDLAFARGQADVLRAQGDAAGARALWESVLAWPSLSGADRALALSELGDAAWAMGDAAAAAERFNQVLALHRDRASDRAAAVKRLSASDPVAGPILRRFFERAAELPDFLALKDLAAQQRENSVARYLLGRALFQREAPAAALPLLDEAERLGLPSAELVRENRRLRVQARYLAGDWSGAEDAARALAAAGDSTDRAFAQDWLERCAFERETFGAPLRAER